MKFIKSIFIIFFSVSMFSFSQENLDTAPKKRPDFVLVFTKTEGYRHESISTGVKALRELGRQNNFIVIRTESPEDFTDQNLKNYQLVVFLSTTGDVLDAEEEKAFENYINGGGSFLGIHAASDTEYEWDWYGKLVGGYFESHPNNPNVLEATVQRIDKTHISTKHLPDSWVRNDEWYNYKNLNPAMTIALNLDESSYKGGTNGKSHPIAWYHEVGQGRAYYSGGGHTNESYKEANFIQHILGAIEWCLNRG